MRPLFIGLAAGFLIPSLPFFLLAPRNYVRDLVAIQFLRHHAPTTASAADRLMYVTGIPGLPSIHATHTLAFILAAGSRSSSPSPTWRRCARTTFDWFVLAAAALSVAAMFISPDFHFHYTYFPAVFVALLFGVSCDRVGRFAGSVASSHFERRPKIGLVPILGVLLIVAAGVWGVGQATRFDRDDPGIITVGDMGLAVEHVVPKGACTVTDEPALTVTANRFVPDRASCPDVVDTFSTWIAYDPKTLPPSNGPFNAKLVAAWRSWLGAADYAVLTDSPFRIPWSPDLIAWFNQNYRLIFELLTGARSSSSSGHVSRHQPTTWWPLVVVSSAAIGSLFGFADLAAVPAGPLGEIERHVGQAFEAFQRVGVLRVRRDAEARSEAEIDPRDADVGDRRRMRWAISCAAVMSVSGRSGTELLAAVATGEVSRRGRTFRNTAPTLASA